jgi:putative ABC transport system permease protein
MLSNYFKIAWRSLLQNKVYTVINLSGLAIGLAVVMLIMVYVQDDLSFDRFHTNEAQLYRLVQDRTDTKGALNKMGNTGFPQGPAFGAEVPEIKAFCRMKNGWNTLVKTGTDAIEEKLLYVDSSMLTMFTFPTLAGNTKGVLGDLKSIIITDRMAEKYFAGKDPIGQILEIGDEGGGEFKPFTVAAVVQHPPLNSSIQFDLLLSLQHLVPTDPDERAHQDNWHNANLNTFLLLQPNADTAAVKAKLATVTASHTADNKGASKANSTMVFGLQSLASMHLDTEYYATNGLEYWSDALYPKVLSILGLLILLLACINFINISIARALRRSKEIGVRKATGGTRGQLMAQFMSESFLMTSLAFVPAGLLAHTLLPVFGKLMDKHLESTYLLQPQTILGFGALLVAVTLLAGFYPAVVLSGFRPIESLKGKLQVAQRPTIGVALVVFQFMIAGVLIIGATIASRQFDYIANKDLGYKTDNIVRFWLPWDEIETKAPLVKSDLKQLAQIEKVSSKSGDWNSTKYEINGQTTDWTYYEHIDENHLQLMGIPLVQGRYLSYAYSQDTISNIVVNEAFVRQYMSGQDPFSTPIIQRGEQSHIVGIVKDFHYASFKEKIKPIAWILDRGTQSGCIHVQIDPKNRAQALAGIQAVYKKHVAYLPIEYFFLEDFRMEQYADDLRWRQILNYATIVAILIACLGLFGLTTFMTERRTKEIGIRKVLGASVANITGLLAKDFIKWVVIALILASPVAYYFMDLWLADFVYRIEIQWWMFALAGLLAVTIAFLTVGFQSVKAALANPVKSLRSE